MKNLKTLPFQVNDKIVELVKADNEARKSLEVLAKASHDALWSAVHEEYPELDVDANYTLNCQFAGQGIVMLTTNKGKCDNPKHALARLLGKMVKEIN